MLEVYCETRNNTINNKTQKNKTDNFTQIEIANESKEMIGFDLENNEILEADFNSKKDSVYQISSKCVHIIGKKNKKSIQMNS
jgi:hypothetical protein